MLQLSDIHFFILGLSAECGGVSRVTLSVMDYNLSRHRPDITEPNRQPANTPALPQNPRITRIGNRRTACRRFSTCLS